jgi:hypothetical protein
MAVFSRKNEEKTVFFGFFLSGKYGKYGQNGFFGRKFEKKWLKSMKNGGFSYWKKRREKKKKKKKLEITQPPPAYP